MRPGHRGFGGGDPDRGALAGAVFYSGFDEFPWVPSDDWEGGVGRDDVVVGSRAIGAEMHSTRREWREETAYTVRMKNAHGMTVEVAGTRRCETTFGWADWERRPIAEIRESAARALADSSETERPDT